MKELLRVIYLSLFEIVMQVAYQIKKNLGNIAVLLQVLIPVAIAKVTNSITVMVLLSICFMLIVDLLKKVSNKLNNTTGEGIPVSNKRFMSADKDGFVWLDNQEELSEALQYLYEIESYLDSKGCYKR